jgi:hypothetical protein
VFTDPWPSNRRPIVARVGSPCNVFPESLSSNGSIRYNIFLLPTALRSALGLLRLPILGYEERFPCWWSNQSVKLTSHLPLSSDEAKNAWSYTLSVHTFHGMMGEHKENFTCYLYYALPVTVAEWSRTWTVLTRLDTGIICSNPTRGMDLYVYVYVYSMFVLSCVGRGLAMSWSLVQGVLPTVLD